VISGSQVRSELLSLTRQTTLKLPNLESLRGRRVLVTGADGFIGSHLTEALVRQGAKVRAIAIYNSFTSKGWLDQTPHDVRDKTEIVVGDIRDPHFVRNVTYGCEIVLHLAALISVPFSYLSPQSFIETNITGTLNVLQAGRDCNVSRIVCTSTSEVYGTACYVPIDEAHPLNAQSPYAATKIAADQLALSFQRTFGTPVMVLRPFNTFGPRQSMRAIIPTIITQIASGLRKIKLGSLHPTRDFSFISDTVRGFMHAAVADEGIGEVVNTGSGFEISIGNTAALIAEIMDVKVEIECSNERVRPATSEVERLFAGIAKAEKVLDWKPDYAGLDGFRRGLTETIAWFNDPDKLRWYQFDEYAV
jgi:dTDP-glucose 4,6-dehydratase